MTRHDCPGIRLQPLGSYLAGLGLIRLIGEQADPAATARWGDDRLVIDTTVPDLAEWLVTQYVPTPVLSPWNAGSGYGAKDKESKRALQELLAHPSPRLAYFRTASAAVDDVLRRARAEGWIKPEGRAGEKVADKTRVIQELRNRCPDALLPWIDATVVLAGGTPSYPPILGSGGNDGRLDFSTTFHQRLLELLSDDPKNRERASGRATDLLTGSQAAGLTKAKVGQFEPASAGGPGSSPFDTTVSLVNPWAYVLLIEGALLFASAAARRHQHGVSGMAAMPFMVPPSPYGFESGAAGEASHGEVWAPVWSKPCTIAEIRQLFSEARASWRGRPAQRAVDFYAATRTLGTARGINCFVRYGMHRRNGLSHVAVPLARVHVDSRPEVRLAAKIEEWVLQVRSPDASSAVGSATRRFDTAHLAYARDGGPQALAGMLAALTSLEQAVGRSAKARERSSGRKIPIRKPPSARDFLTEFAKAEQCPELRVAVGIASCTTRPGDGKPARSMRQILLPVDPEDSEQRTGRWREAPLVPGFGLRSLPQVLTDVLIWRSRTADEGESQRSRPAPVLGRTAADENGKKRLRGVPAFRWGVLVPTADLHAFAHGLLDGGELDLWLRACLALDWSGVDAPWTKQPEWIAPVPTLGLLQPLASGVTPVGRGSDSPALALEPDWASRLAAGQVQPVHGEAAARLRQAGWQAVPFQPVSPHVPEVTGVDIAAALVPRCREPQSMMKRCLAVRLCDEPRANDSVAATEETESSAPHTPELA